MHLLAVDPNAVYIDLYILVNESDSGRGKLFVYTITPTSISQAPGSTYSIPNPLNIIVKYR